MGSLSRSTVAYLSLSAPVSKGGQLANWPANAGLISPSKAASP